MGTNPRNVHTGLTHCSKFKSTNKWRRSSTCMNLGNTLQWNFYPWKSLKIFFALTRKWYQKPRLGLENLVFSARFARKSLEMHKTSTFCIILRVDFGRKQSNVSFYRFNFEKFCVSFFNVSFYRVIILVVHFWKKIAYGVYHFTGWSFYRGNKLLFTRVSFYRNIIL